MAVASSNEFPKVIMEEVATDGSATVTPAADHRALFLGEDGLLHVKDSAGAVTDPWTSGSGAPTTADYLVGTTQGGLSAEIVVGTTPGGELGNTWASPTVDTTHSGSSHAGVITAHEAASDPHTGYLKESDFTGVDFLVGTATGITASEIVVGTTPGGELGGTWASPTVDATHSGSSHASLQPLDTDLTDIAALTRTRGDLLVGGASAWTDLAIGTDGKLLASDGTDAVWETQYAAVNAFIDGGGSVITTGLKGVVRVPFAGSIEEATIVDLNGASASIVVDIKKRALGGGAASSICASAKPTLSTDDEATDTTLTGWTLTIAAGDLLYFTVDSATVTTGTLVYLKIRKT